MKSLAKEVLLALITFVRMMLVVLVMLAFWQRAWLPLALGMVGFGVLTAFISKVLNAPSADDVRLLTKALRDALEIPPDVHA